jgi:alanine-glyoxylate transaminase/serine-glyoxylate transaminase/serine-pyruvate transaminase
LLEGYWGDERAYHHTAPVTNVYALREALRLVAEEGIEARWDRHRRIAGSLTAGLEAMGLETSASTDHWLPSLTTVAVPDGVDDAWVIDRLLDAFGVEIASGLGALEGDVWRVGCMGHSARHKNVRYLLSALGEVLATAGVPVDVDAGLAAATAAD